MAVTAPLGRATKESWSAWETSTRAPSSLTAKSVMPVSVMRARSRLARSSTLRCSASCGWAKARTAPVAKS